MTATGVLVRARAALVARGLARGKFEDRLTGAVCLVGALRIGAGGQPDGGPMLGITWYSEAQQAIGQVLRVRKQGGFLSAWSDTRELPEVLAVLDEAIAAEAAGDEG